MRAPKLYRCHKCNKVERHETWPHPDNPMLCCGVRMTWQRIAGTYNKEHKCDIRCTSAKGPKCNCQCGGQNHASDWSQLGRPMSEVLSS